MELIQFLLASLYGWKDFRENKCLKSFSHLTLFYERIKSSVKHLHLVLCVLMLAHWHIPVKQGREFMAIRGLSRTLK